MCVNKFLQRIEATIQILPSPIYQYHCQMRPTRRAQSPAKTVQNWDLPAMAYGQEAHGNNLVLAYKMDLKSVEYTEYNEIREKPSLIRNLWG